MAAKHDKQSAEFKSGLFIIISLALLIFSILWLRYFAITPDKHIVARFRDPGPVERGMPVYYQGVNVGKVPKIEFSKNFKYTYVYLDIYKKLELPANITAMVKTEGLAGQKYVNISYPSAFHLFFEEFLKPRLDLMSFRNSSKKRWKAED